MKIRNYFVLGMSLLAALSILIAVIVYILAQEKPCGQYMGNGPTCPSVAKFGGSPSIITRREIESSKKTEVNVEALGLNTNGLEIFRIYNIDFGDGRSTNAFPTKLFNSPVCLQSYPASSYCAPYIAGVRHIYEKVGIYTLTFSSLGSVLATSTVVIGGDFYKRLKSSVESGVAPLNVTFLLAPDPRNRFKNFDTIDFGDGTTGVFKWKEAGNIPEWDLPLETSHVYTSPGSYDVKYSGSGGYGDHVHISVRNH